MDNRNKKYTREFKEEAVRLLLTKKISAGQLGRELGVSGASLGNWKRKALRNGDHPPQIEPRGSRVQYSVLEMENIRLKNELESLKRRMTARIRELLGLIIGGPVSTSSQEVARENLGIFGR